MTDSNSTITEPTVQITRTFDAPPELVFRAWSDAKQLLRWYAPHGCTLSFCEIEFREGGRIHSCIRTPDGDECWCSGKYLEIIEPTKISFSMAFCDPQGNFLEPHQVGADPEWPRESVVTVTFTALPDNRTQLALHQSVSETVAKRTGAYPSWLQMLDRLAELLVKP